MLVLKEGAEAMRCEGLGENVGVVGGGLKRRVRQRLLRRRRAVK